MKPSQEMMFSQEMIDALEPERSSDKGATDENKEGIKSSQSICPIKS
jgi:hypothetical protein